MSSKNRVCIKCEKPCTRNLCRDCFEKKGSKVSQRIHVRHKKLEEKKCQMKY